MFRALSVLVCIYTFIGAASAQTLDGVPADFDYCPELERTADNPDGNRDCGPGCIEETEFSFENGIAAVHELTDMFLNPGPQPDHWENDVAKHANLAISLGTILRLRLLFAHQYLIQNADDPTATREYGTYRAAYCEFLKTANYLD